MHLLFIFILCCSAKMQQTIPLKFSKYTLSLYHYIYIYISVEVFVYSFVAYSGLNFRLSLFLWFIIVLCNLETDCRACSLASSGGKKKE